MSDDKPAPIWLFHPPSGRLQQTSRAGWDAARAAAQEGTEGPWHGWVEADPAQAELGESLKPAPPAEPAPARRARQ